MIVLQILNLRIKLNFNIFRINQIKNLVKFIINKFRRQILIQQLIKTKKMIFFKKKSKSN